MHIPPAESAHQNPRYQGLTCIIDEDVNGRSFGRCFLDHVFDLRPVSNVTFVGEQFALAARRLAGKVAKLFLVGAGHDYIAPGLDEQFGDSRPDSPSSTGLDEVSASHHKHFSGTQRARKVNFH